MFALQDTIESNVMEEALVSVIERLMQNQWNNRNTDELDLADSLNDLEGKLANVLGGSSQMTLLHLAASLGYTRYFGPLCHLSKL